MKVETVSVFSTYVEMILDEITDVSGQIRILHVCGDDPAFFIA